MQQECVGIPLTALALPGAATGDAIMATRAMQAATSAEILAEEGAVRVELEVGAEDLQGFRNLLADARRFTSPTEG